MRIARIMWALAIISARPLFAQAVDSTYGRGPHDPDVAIIRQVPSFAGMWFDKEGNFHGSLAIPSDSSTLRTILEAYMADRRRSFLLKPGMRIIIDEVRYSYAQLYEWQRKLEKLAVGVSGFQSIGPVEMTNQIRVGVTKPEAIAKVYHIAESLKIPTGVVRAELEGEVVLDVGKP